MTKVTTTPETSGTETTFRERLATLGVRGWLDWLLITIAVVMVAVGITGYVAARQVHQRSELRNHALIDPVATAQVQSEVSQALTQVLSYDYANPAPTQKAAQQLLAGAARGEYDTLFTTLQHKAAGQKLVLTAQVQSAGVKTLTADTATLLVFLDQASQRVTDKQASVSAAELQVDAERVGGTWKVTGITPL